MVRLTDLPEVEARHLRDKPCPRFLGEPFVSGLPLPERRVAVVTTAGLHRRGVPVFNISDTSYRVIAGETAAADLVMSHTSANFDRTGFQQDLNVVLPLDRLREAQAAGEIGSTANAHYSLMGALWEPHEIEATARQLADMLRQDRVDAVLLVPV